MNDKPELVVLSHLRWSWVWQRPQHLVSRLARHHDVWFVEEPAVADVGEPVLRVEVRDGITVARLDVPRALAGADSSDGSDGSPARLDFDGVGGELYADALAGALGERPDRRAWLYTPLALDVANSLAPSVLVYDVMDDLSAFRGASPSLALAHRRAIREADLVFSGGKSLHRGVTDLRRGPAHLFPSGVEPEHFEQAVALRAVRGPGDRPVAGYVGVIDERIDLDLVAGLAARLPDWEIAMVGPVAKIDEADLPRSPNITYHGQQPYERLPDFMAMFDVALMPFARNEATRSISPTKTLEYLAAGLPVVSTRVPDVVSSYPDVVDLRDDAAGFADACRHVLGHDPVARRRKADPHLEWQRWDTIASRMCDLVDAHERAFTTQVGSA